MTVIDMTRPDTRRRAQLLQAIFALSLEIRTGLKHSKASYIQVAQRLLGDDKIRTRKQALPRLVAAAIGEFGFKPNSRLAGLLTEIQPKAKKKVSK